MDENLGTTENLRTTDNLRAIRTVMPPCRMCGRRTTVHRRS
jgi:hypothetical protein